MTNIITRLTSEWKPFSELKEIQRDISELGYKKEYIEEHGLEKTKMHHFSNMGTGVVNYYEPLEVMSKDDKVFWRYNENHTDMDVPDTFETQFGPFNNHNHGEFISWLGRDDYGGLPEEERKFNRLIGINDFFVEGNYCDMFDCGEYTYAISNLMHLYMGMFKIVRIDKNLDTVVIYDNYQNNEHSRLEYNGRFQNQEGFVLITSGVRELKTEEDKKSYQKTTILFQIDMLGNCSKYKEWDFEISSSNSMVTVGDYVYFGQNKMVTQLNVLTGEMAFFTNKSDDEISVLVNVI